MWWNGVTTTIWTWRSRHWIVDFRRKQLTHTLLLFLQTAAECCGRASWPAASPSSRRAVMSQSGRPCRKWWRLLQESLISHHIQREYSSQPSPVKPGSYKIPTISQSIYLIIYLSIYFHLIHVLEGIFWYSDSCTCGNLKMRCRLFCCSADHTEIEEALSFQLVQTKELHSNCKMHLLNLLVFIEMVR